MAEVRGAVGRLRASMAQPPLVYAGIAVPVALVLALLGPTFVASAGLGAATPYARLLVELGALGFALAGVWLADQAEVEPRVESENLRVLLVLGGLVTTMFAGAFLWLAAMEIVALLV